MFDLTLTFDNGPEPDVTPFVLDTLAVRGIFASFFVLGHKLADPAVRALAERAKAAGHWIGNHSWSHTIPLGRLDDVAVTHHEIVDTQRELGSLAEARKLFRPFGGGGVLDDGLLNGEAVRLLTEGGFTCVLWNAIPRDWELPDDWVELALEQCRERDWTLMVLHDLPTGAMRRLPEFLDRAAEAGARFRQDFPPECVPIESGEVVRPIEQFVAA